MAPVSPFWFGVRVIQIIPATNARLCQAPGTTARVNAEFRASSDIRMPLRIRNHVCTSPRALPVSSAPEEICYDIESARCWQVIPGVADHLDNEQPITFSTAAPVEP